MSELLTAAQMRAIEQAAIAEGSVTGLELMERAGRCVVEAIFEEWPEIAPSWGPAPKPPEYLLQDDEQGEHRAVVLCGPGNNGGDGFVVARLLKEAGWDVDVFLHGDPDKLPPDARANYELWQIDNDLEPIDLFDAWEHDYALAVDAIFGTGVSRPLADDVLQALDDMGDIKRTVAVDITSGICANSGRALRPAHLNGIPPFAGAHLCVTFHAGKIGHLLADTPEITKKLKVVDIGLNRQDALRRLGYLAPKDGSQDRDKTVIVKLHERDIFTAAFMHGQSILDKDLFGHKYAHGHALVVAGGNGQGGAARLAARSALRIGAGAVTVGCRPAAFAENAAHLNAVMLRKFEDDAALTRALEDARFNALCLGPGMGVTKKGQALVEAGLMSGRAIVLDADALTLIGRDAPLFAMLHETCVLTPHAGEFARLFPDIAKKLDEPASHGPAYSKVDATRDAAKRAGCVVVFKGPDTVIADHNGHCVINGSVYERSAPWLATAGSGDVLAGFITGLLARGFAPMQAAETGAWLHTECALSFGPGLIAEDLSEELPKVFRALGL